jgi:hypothetical protein
MSMEGRLTVCNMSIEAGARAGMIAPDDTTLAYLAGRPYMPTGRDWEQAVDRWRALPSDPGAAFDRELALDATVLEPMNKLGHERRTPHRSPPGCPTRRTSPAEQRAALSAAGSWDWVAASRHPRRSGVHRVVPMDASRTCVPLRSPPGARSPPGRGLGRSGSGLVKVQAEAEGLDRISLKPASGGTLVARCVSAPTATGRARTAPRRPRTAPSSGANPGHHAPAEPAMAAAAAVTGRLTDVRQLVLAAPRDETVRSSSRCRSRSPTSTPTRSCRRATCRSRAPTTSARTCSATCATADAPDPGFALNQPPYRGARIVVAGHLRLRLLAQYAAWARRPRVPRRDRASFGDIFHSNARTACPSPCPATWSGRCSTGWWRCPAAGSRSISSADRHRARRPSARLCHRSLRETAAARTRRITLAQLGLSGLNGHPRQPLRCTRTRPHARHEGRP